MALYKGVVTFCGFIGSDEIYEVEADNEEEALEEINEQATSDLEVLDVEQVDDDEYEVTIRFAGFIGIEETYTVYADSEEDAEFNATDEAAMDLNIELSDEEDEYDEDEEDF